MKQRTKILALLNCAKNEIKDMDSYLEAQERQMQKLVDSRAYYIDEAARWRAAYEREVDQAGTIKQEVNEMCLEILKHVSKSSPIPKLIEDRLEQIFLPF